MKSCTGKRRTGRSTFSTPSVTQPTSYTSTGRPCINISNTTWVTFSICIIYGLRVGAAVLARVVVYVMQWSDRDCVDNSPISGQWCNADGRRRIARMPPMKMRALCMPWALATFWMTSRLATDRTQTVRWGKKIRRIHWPAKVWTNTYVLLRVHVYVAILFMHPRETESCSSDKARTTST